jgi:hypothetical protein
MDEAESGLDARDRGQILEQALEVVWNHLRDHFTLQNTLAEDLSRIIATAVGQAMEMLEPSTERWLCRHRALERQRMVGLITEWLQLEKRREAFKVVEHQRKIVASAGGISVKGRIDRVDQTNDGHLVILDYKTGSSSYSAAQWRGQRPEKPQLQLYVGSQPTPVSGVAFAVVQRGACDFKGYAARPQILGKQRDNTGRHFLPGDTFEAHIGRWQAVLDGIGQAYAAGGADVDPSPARVCDYCHLAALCRIAEQERTAPDELPGDHTDEQ